MVRNAIPWLAVCLGIASVSCGSRKLTVSNAPDPKTPKLALPEPPDQRILLPAASDKYVTERDDGPAALGAKAAELAMGFTSTWGKLRTAPIVGDHRLADLALWLATCEAKGLSVDTKVIALGAQRLGIPFADLLIVEVKFGETVSAEQLVALLKPPLEAVPRNRVFSRYGVGVVQASDGFRGTVVITPAEVTLRPVARKMRKGSNLELQGEVSDRYDLARLAVTLPSGKVATFQTSGRRFEGRFAVSEEGIYKVELLGDGATGPVVVANFPLYVDTSEPEEVPKTQAAPLDPTLTAERMEEMLLALVNGERANASAPAVEKSDALAVVAAAHSHDMSGNAFFSHISPTSGTTVERIRRSNLPLVSFGENIVEAGTVQEAHENLLASPAHRSVIVDPRFTHVGIGIVVRPPPALAIVATEVFGELRPLDPAAGRKDVLEQLNMARLTRALGAVHEQLDLRLAAEHGLELRLRDPQASVEVIKQTIDGELKQHAGNVSRAGIRSTSVTTLEAKSVGEAANLAPLFAANLKAIGIAIAPKAKNGPPTAQLVVLVLGYR